MWKSRDTANTFYCIKSKEIYTNIFKSDKGIQHNSVFVQYNNF